jgi:hypothetical protein
MSDSGGRRTRFRSASRNQHRARRTPLHTTANFPNASFCGPTGRPHRVDSDPQNIEREQSQVIQTLLTMRRLTFGSSIQSSRRKNSIPTAPMCGAGFRNWRSSNRPYSRALEGAGRGACESRRRPRTSLPEADRRPRSSALPRAGGVREGPLGKSAPINILAQNMGFIRLRCIRLR